MPSLAVRQEVAEALETLSDEELREVADYVAYLRFRGRLTPRRDLDIAMLATLYAECRDEDRVLAEEGLAAWNERLRSEDSH